MISKVAYVVRGRDTDFVLSLIPYFRWLLVFDLGVTLLQGIMFI